MHTGEDFLIAIASILILGVGAQWLAWRLGQPSILLLLLMGFVAGPLTGFLDPDALFGDKLFPLVSVSVAIILFEGGMSLQLSELRGNGRIIRNLVSIGAMTTLVICALSAIWILELPPPQAALLGAVLVVTGPTVIGPLLRVVQPAGKVGPILKWEGIAIDPVGATLAVLVFGAILEGELQSATAGVVEGMVRTVLDGGALGALGAGLVILLLRRYLVPEYLQSPVVLMVVIGVFTAANLLQPESGLLAVTLMGIILSNQNLVVVKQILNFKENLRVLLIGTLFILLTARLSLNDLLAVGVEGLIFLGIVVLVARPVSVMLSTLGSDLNWRERVFLSWMAPRGIVAASVSSLFSLQMAEAGLSGADQLVPLTFLVIVGTVSLYSLTAMPVARLLGLSRPHPQGVLIAGAHPLARIIGSALKDRGYQVLLIDTNQSNTELAELAGLPTFQGDILSAEVREHANLVGIGRLLAMTANDNVNALAVREWAEVFGSSEVYQLAPQHQNDDERPAVLRPLRGLTLFGSGLTYTALTERLDDGASVVISAITETSEEATRGQICDKDCIPLFIINAEGMLVIVTAERSPTLRSKQILISLTNGDRELPSNATRIFTTLQHDS